MRIIVEQVNLPTTSTPCSSVLLHPCTTTDLSNNSTSEDSPLSHVLIEDDSLLLDDKPHILDKSDKMWSSAGLGPPTYHMFPAYDDYRGGMSEFAGGTAGLAGAGSSWVTAGTTSPPAAPQTPVTSPNETEESVSIVFFVLLYCVYYEIVSIY